MGRIQKVIVASVGFAVAGLAGPASTQPHDFWDARWDGQHHFEDIGYSVALDSAGNVVVAGSTTGLNGDYDFLVLKYDRYGSLLWSQRYAGPGAGNDYGWDIAVDSADNVFISGPSEGVGTAADFAVIKYDATGALVWENRYDGPASGNDYTGIDALGVAADGSVTLTGYSTGLSGRFEAATVRYASDGSLLWARRYAGPAATPEALGYSLRIDSTGAALVGGDANDATGEPSIIVLKYLPNGDLAWDTFYDGPYDGDEVSYNLGIDANDNAYMSAAVPGANGLYDYAVFKVDSSGAILWDATYDGGSVDYPFGVATGPDDSCFVTGISTDFYGNGDYATMKVNPDGTVAWVQRFSQPRWFADDTGVDIVVNSAGVAFVTGYSWAGPSEGRNAVTIGYDAAGTVVWQREFNGAADGDDGGFGLALGPNDDLYLTGFSLGAGTDADVLVQRFRAAPDPTLTVSPSPLIAGQLATFTVNDAEPIEDLYLAYSLIGGGNGPFVPFLGVALDLLGPQQAGAIVQTDASGSVAWTLPIPSSAAGTPVWFQAAHRMLVSNVVGTQVD